MFFTKNTKKVDWLTKLLEHTVIIFVFPRYPAIRGQEALLQNLWECKEAR